MNFFGGFRFGQHGFVSKKSSRIIAEHLEQFSDRPMMMPMVLMFMPMFMPMAMWVIMSMLMCGLS